MSQSSSAGVPGATSSSRRGLLHGRVALVTGASRGLGRAIGLAFAEEGAIGLLVDRPDAEPEGPPAPGFRSHVADVTQEPTMEAAIAEAMDRYGRLDVVVANAGLVPPWRETESLDLAEWDRVLAVNVRGVAATLKHAVPAMKQRGGSILVMCSLNSFHPHPRQMLYTATKHAALGIVRAAAQDLGRYGIRVNGLAPGPIATEALKQRIAARSADGGPALATVLADLAKATALQRLATAEEVARAAVLLSSDLASGITGALLPVDAGLP